MDSLIINPSYLKPFKFEKYDFQKWNRLMANYWWISIYLSIIYLVLVFGGRKWMQKRKAFELRGPLLLWNLFLCVGSLIAFLRLYPELWNELVNHGVYHSVCNRDEHTITHSFWTLVFVLSKIMEFGDTAFIGNPYHHITVAIYCFYALGNGKYDPANRWFCVVNALIHTIMYGYYALKAMKVPVPKNFAMAITSLQILQMVMGLYIIGISYYYKVTGIECVRPYSNMFWGFLEYGSYFLLFVNFFLKSYHQKKPETKEN